VLARNPAGRICGFTVSSHADSFVCAAVSMLVINTANSIEMLTDEPISCAYENEVFIQVELPRVKTGHHSHDANILLEAMWLGLRSVKENYGNEIEIEDDKYD
jgi:uncharacterized protein YsxB (DUF464 family)